MRLGRWTGRMRSRRRLSLVVEERERGGGRALRDGGVQPAPRSRHCQRFYRMIAERGLKFDANDRTRYWSDKYPSDPD